MALTITITNYSKYALQRKTWTCAAGESGSKGTFDELAETPSETLEANCGMTTAEADTYLFNWMVQDCLYLRVGYEANNESFTVEIRNRFQLFGIGKGVAWSYAKNGEWKDMGGDSSTVTLTLNAIIVELTPNLSRQSGSISVVIKNS